MSTEKVEEAIISLERAVLDRWCKGDPGGFVENALDEVTWFDHTSASRVDGRSSLAEHVSRYVGQFDVPQYDMPNVKVDVYGDIAVLTTNWHTFSGDGELTSRWNATEVFRRTGTEWQYLHMHWAPSMPQM